MWAREPYAELVPKNTSTNMQPGEKEVPSTAHSEAHLDDHQDFASTSSRSADTCGATWAMWFLAWGVLRVEDGPYTLDSDCGWLCLWFAGRRDEVAQLQAVALELVGSGLLQVHGEGLLERPCSSTAGGHKRSRCRRRIRGRWSTDWRTTW